MRPQHRLRIIGRRVGGSDDAHLGCRGEGDGDAARNRLAEKHPAGWIELKLPLLFLLRLSSGVSGNPCGVETVEPVPKFRYDGLMPTKQNDLVVLVVVELLRNQFRHGLNLLQFNPLPTDFEAVLQWGEGLRGGAFFRQMIQEQFHRRLFAFNGLQEAVEGFDPERGLRKPAFRVDRAGFHAHIAKQQWGELR